MRNYLDDLVECSQILMHVFQNDSRAANIWLNSAHVVLKGETPLSFLLKCDAQSVTAILFNYAGAEGVFDGIVTEFDLQKVGFNCNFPYGETNQTNSIPFRETKGGNQHAGLPD